MLEKESLEPIEEKLLQHNGYIKRNSVYNFKFFSIELKTK